MIKMVRIMKIEPSFYYSLAICGFTAIYCLLTTCVQAEQLSFTKERHDETYTFTYQWLDHEKKLQSMRLNLTNQALFNHFRQLKTYKSEFAQKTILRNLKKQIKKQPLQGAQAFFLQRDGKMTIQIKGQEDKNIVKAYQQIKEMEQKATDKYFKDNYYQAFTTADQQFGIKVNHIDIAHNSVSDFKAIKMTILEKVSIKDIRQVTNFVLAFVQSIPYSTLESRISSSGAGFNPPAKLIWENQGDCDSKMTLTATILRALMPRIEMAMIYIDQHAFIGIAIPVEGSDMHIKHEGITYVLAEPTGPALYRLGKLTPESELAIKQKRYVAEAYLSDGSY